MKHKTLLITLFAVLCLASCGKEEEQNNPSGGNDTIPTGGGGTTPTAVPGRLPGLFSVSATKQVYFSQGNLQWSAEGAHATNGPFNAAGTWRFATHQYDVVGSPSWYASMAGSNAYPGNVSGSDNSFIAEDYTGWIDLFGWGTSGYHNSSDRYNTNYHPYSSSQNWVNRTYNDQGYGPSTNMEDLDLTGTSANYDWGVYNAISNGGDAPGLWRTLTRDEWDYLRNGRADADSKYAIGRIQMADSAYVNGCFFLPDSWTLPDGCAFTPGTTSSYTDYSLNTYTLAQWSLMEAAGALFLPTCGERYGTVIHVGTNGCYWSASHIDSGSANTLGFNSFYVEIGEHAGRAFGFGVRLVHDK